MKVRAVVGVVGVMGVILVGCSTESVDNLQPGDCFNLSNASTEQEISQVPTVDCSKEHTAEVYLVTDLQSSIAYDDQAVFDLGFEVCLEAFEGYVGVDYFDDKAYNLDVSVIYPLELDWNKGDRGITCVITPIDLTDKLTGTAKNSLSD